MERDNSEADADILRQAAKARQLGYDGPERVVQRLEKIIIRNGNYLAYRKRAGRHGAFNEQIEEDTAVLAMAIVLLESTQ